MTSGRTRRRKRLMDKLIDLFKIYLSTQSISATSVKNYVVDLRNFLEWFTLHVKTNRMNVEEEEPVSLACAISQEKIDLYKQFLLNNETPFKTINRRLSTMRKFGSFAINQGWQTTNIAREIQNAGIKPVQKPDLNRLILNEYRSSLKEEKISPVTIKNYVADIGQFLRFVSQI